MPDHTNKYQNKYIIIHKNIFVHDRLFAYTLAVNLFLPWAYQSTIVWVFKGVHPILMPQCFQLCAGGSHCQMELIPFGGLSLCTAAEVLISAVALNSPLPLGRV